MFKKFFFAATSVLILAWAFHLGACDADAQAGRRSVGVLERARMFGDELVVLLENGDICVAPSAGGDSV